MDQRKVKIGGMEKVEAAEAKMKEFVSVKWHFWRVRQSRARLSAMSC